MTSKKTMVQAESHVCPWWVAYTFDNPLRKIFHNPRKMLSAYIKAGMCVMDVGCGLGYFSIGMAKIVGETGKVIAVDLQQKMLDIMQKRARRAGLQDRIYPHLCQPDDIGDGARSQGPAGLFQSAKSPIGSRRPYSDR